ncbi:MAG: hypothetical protein ACRC4T_22430 [Cetobacterium sp.]
MKKLLSALFILGSISVLANEAVTLPADADPAFCFENPCSATQDFKVKVRVPQKLVIDADDVDLGIWCGDKDKNTEVAVHHTITGEPNTTVNVGFKNNGELKFKKDGDLLHKFKGTITHSTGSVNLDGTGSGEGGVKVHVPKLLSNVLLEAGQEYKATATLVAAYDTAGF